MIQDYFDKLFNEDGGTLSIELENSSNDLNRHFVHWIKEYEVKDALKMMKGRKVVGLDWISIEV
jgi:hypothetical protein